MKRILLAGTAMGAASIGCAYIPAPALAADGIKLSLDGFFQTAVLANFDDHKAGELGNKRYNDGVFSDAEIYFTGKTTLDNGLTVGARVELEAEQNDNQIDAAYVFFQGGFGEVRIGSQDGAMMTQCITPVGGTANFGAFSQDEIINNAFSDTGFSNGICNSVDGFGLNIPGEGTKTQKIVYLSPDFGGFQLGLSWSPNGAHEFTDVTDFHSGMPAVINGEQRNVVDAYATYSHDFDDWSISWGGGGSWALSVGGDSGGIKKNDYYQSGVNLTFGNFSIGAAGEYYHNMIHFDDGSNGNGWVIGGGMAYTLDALTMGLQYSHGDFDFTEDHTDRRVNTVAATGNYALGPGIALDGTVQYTWAGGDQGDAAHGGYDAVSFGLGSSFTF